MKAETLQNEKQLIRQKIQEMKAKIVHQIERGQFLGLDQKIRKIQKSYQIIQRI